MDIQQLEKELSQILLELNNSETLFNTLTAHVDKEYKLSAKNLLRYLILRSKDLRVYHGLLSDLGISSLRSGEGYVYNNLYSVVRNIHLIQNSPFKIDKNADTIGYSNSIQLIKSHTDDLFNQGNKEEGPVVMVTLPDEAAEDKDLIKKMVVHGMKIARINLGHGDLSIWKKMVESIQSVEKETSQKIQIYIDLSGPKLRTSKIAHKDKEGKIKDYISIKTGDKIILTKASDFKDKPVFKKSKKVVEVVLEQVVDETQIGDFLLFDDGMIKSKVIEKNEHYLVLKITECYKTKLGSYKGINLPNTKLSLPALTTQDLEVLPFACEYADIIGYSFVRNNEDVRQLYEALQKNNAKDVGIVFKIENKEAFENLPDILIKGMERNKIGVMIARGDLAVEIGFERISEVQNEILWLCEAAHVPVIWATQVLDNLAKTGIPTRAEISDAALSVKAECVMLNKGPYILEAIKVLKNILTRMEEHSFKKKDELRALNIAKHFIDKINS